MLYEIGLNESNVVVPVIEVLDDDDFHLARAHAKDVQMGGFRLGDLTFDWHFLPEREHKRRNYKYHLPFR